MKIFLLSILIALSFGLCDLNAETGEIFTIGFFEGGDNTEHGAFRRQFRDQLSIPGLTNKRIIFIPDGFKTADWDRKKSKELALEFVADKSIDLVVALGPWTVEDLLEAGFERPIVTAVRFNTQAEKLIDQNARPIVDNLTVRFRPNKIASDIEYLFSLIPIKKLGFLHFPSGNESEKVLAEVQKAVERYGAEVVTASGFNVNGAYAYFKSYNALSKDIDALYLAPLWGFTPEKTRQFFNMTIREHLPTFSAEGEYNVIRGAMAAGSLETARERAKYHVWKVIQIINGTVPADLPTTMPDISGLTINDYVANGAGIRRDGRFIHQAVLIESPPSDNIEHLNLSTAIGLGLAQNPDYLSKYELLEAAQNAVAEVSSSYYPQISVDMSAQMIRNSPEGILFQDNTNQYFAGINLNQTILSLTTLRDISLASERKNLVAVRYRQAALDLELGITLGCIELIRARQLRDVELSTLKNIRQSVNVTKINSALGEGEVSDQLRLESEWLQFNRRVFSAGARRDISHQLLNIILGRPGSIEFYLSDKEFSRSQLTGQLFQLQTILTNNEAVNAAVDQLSAIADNSSPELQTVSIALAITNLNLSKNRVSWLPQIGFQATLGYNSVTYPNVNSSYWDGKEEFSRWMIGAELQWSLFEGGKRSKAKSRLTSEMRAIENQADNTRLLLSGKIHSSLIRIKNLADSYPLALQSATISNEYLSSSLDLYNMSKIPLVGLLDALEHDNESAKELINIYFNYFVEASHLMHLLGISPYDNNSNAGYDLVTTLSTITDR